MVRASGAATRRCQLPLPALSFLPAVLPPPIPPVPRPGGSFTASPPLLPSGRFRAGWRSGWASPGLPGAAVREGPRRCCQGRGRGGLAWPGVGGRAAAGGSARGSAGPGSGRRGVQARPAALLSGYFPVSGPGTWGGVYRGNASALHGECYRLM